MATASSVGSPGGSELASQDMGLHGPEPESTQAGSRPLPSKTRVEKGKALGWREGGAVSRSCPQCPSSPLLGNPNPAGPLEKVLRDRPAVRCLFPSALQFADTVGPVSAALGLPGPLELGPGRLAVFTVSMLRSGPRSLLGPL